MNRAPFNVFKTEAQTGVDKIPVGFMFIVQNYKGTGVPYLGMKNSLGDLTPDDTVEDMIQKGVCTPIPQSNIYGLGDSARTANNIVILSQADYDAIPTKDPNTIYHVIDEES
jgi:hypothetical protein